jgi:hypothetical protein
LIAGLAPVELKVKPLTCSPSPTTLVMTATIEVAVSEKSKLDFFSSYFSGMAGSRMLKMCESVSCSMTLPRLSHFGTHQSRGGMAIVTCNKDFIPALCLTL